MTTQSLCAKAAVGPSSLAQKLARFATLSPAEAAVLDELPSTSRVVKHNREIISQGRRHEALLVMVEGISVRYRILRDGRRQVLNIALPGDLIGFPACFFERAPYSISALTDTVLACIPFRALAGLFETHPRLAAAVLWSFASEAAIYIEHLTDVGRRTALERVAHFLLELLVRFQGIGQGDGRSFPMPLTQELLADALGLSVPHVNRTLRQLRNDDLVRIEAHRVTVNDVEALATLADFEPSYLGGFRPLDLFDTVANGASASL
jgi:CRP-like cAMP-binding protein